ncbi:MAG: peptidase S41 [Acidobacteria bacterium]|nr:MAG: peptidase S41 [Acidobacteriota bacterium]PIE89744.1 MAG: peptidase S41 [Acidobacteriota bacterium]
MNRKNVGVFVLFLLIFGSLALAKESGGARLVKQPTLSETQMAFAYAGDIWVCDRDGSHARRLTTHEAVEANPHFSPDGTQIAFTASYDNNLDVYVIDVEGGQPRRLTCHPAPDVVCGWSPDGKNVLFSSDREILNSRSRQLYHVSKTGGAPVKVMEAIAFEGSWNKDGQTLAYRPFPAAHARSSGWHLHRGGTTPPIWIINPAKNKVEKIPHGRSNDHTPMWFNDNVYFISDQDDIASNLYEYNRKTKSSRQLTFEKDWNVNSAAIRGGVIVYEVAGGLKQLEIDSGKISPIEIPIKLDSPQLRPQWKSTADQIQSIGLSKTGKRALLTARGDVYTVPLKDGSTRNITATPGIRERDALWSHNGERIAYLTENREKAPFLKHDLVLEDQKGMKPAQTVTLGIPGYLNLLSWSPNDKLILFQDNHLNLYVIELDTGEVKLIDTNQRRSRTQFSFSSDSRWLAYTVNGENYFSQIKLYHFETDTHHMLTDGMSHASHPVFAKKDYLYFTASVNTGPRQVDLDMSSQERALRSGIYAVVLAKDGKSPLLPKSGDEEVGKKEKTKAEKKAEDGADEKGEKKKDESEIVQIDFEGLLDRVIALPIPERNYDSLKVAHDGALFYIERSQPGVSNELPGFDWFAKSKLRRFDFKKKESQVAMDKVGFYTLSSDGKKLLLMTSGGRLVYADAGEKLKPKPLKLTGVKALVNPREEWKQIFNEVWWMEYQYFYDPAMHGSDWKAVYDKYEPLVEHVVCREDLNTLMVEMIGELEVGHNRVGGGDVHREKSASFGLLGADFTIDRGHYQIARIYTGEKWNPFLKAPLAVPGMDAQEGDYILAINGQALTSKDNIFSYLEGTQGTQVTLTLNSEPRLEGSREIIVEPVHSERKLRHWYWVEKNRRYVDQKTNGKVAYVYLPNTAGSGFRYFNRMFFAQIHKKAVIIDERRNGGGQAANYITDVLSREYLSGWKDRDGLVSATPAGAIYGPKVMLIDQDAGSGGDFLPYAFKRLGLGQLVGKRTWGGLIGISTNPGLIDGGFLVVPFFRFFTPDNEWRVENEGVAPDIDIDLEPDQVNQGRDSQLDKAIEVIMADLKNYKPIKLQKAPAMPTELGK